jgi:hypothetical protein
LLSRLAIEIEIYDYRMGKTDINCKVLANYFGAEDQVGCRESSPYDKAY